MNTESFNKALNVADVNGTKSSRKALAQAVALAATLACPTLSQANMLIEEVVVTARKKATSESIQEVPISVTAVNGDMIDRRFFNDLTDLGKIAPNVSLNPVGSFPGTANFFIRGMGVFGSIPSDETAVGIIQDGVYLGVNAGALTSLFDIESVEVLRGPQGTLFGRNVTGGAVIVRSRRPEAEFSGHTRARFGDYQQRSIDAAIGGTLADDDSVMGRVALGYQSNGDYFDNVAGPDRGEGETRYLRPSIRFQLSENIDLTLIGEINQFDGDGVVSKNIALVDVLDDHQVAMDIDNQAEYEVKHLIGDLGWLLGDGELRVIAGWRDTYVEGELDGDGLAATAPKVHSGIVPWQSSQEQVSLEVRYSTPVGSTMDVTLGAYYFDQEIDYAEPRTLNLGTPTDVNVGAGAELEHSSFAGFVQGDIQLAPDWTLTVGTRYTVEDKDAKVASFGSCNAAGRDCVYDFTGSDEWDFISGHVGLKWNVAETAQTYATWTRSFRSGGFNLRNSLPSVPGPYDEEQIDAYELGFKSDWNDGRVRFNSAIFHNEYFDLQRTVIVNDPVTGVRQDKLNAADATIQGLEVEMALILTDNFRVDLSGGLIDAEYDSFEGGDVNWQLPNVPETNGNITLTYNMPVGNGELEARASATYTDKQFGNVENTPILELDAYTVVDASIAYWLPGDAIRVSVYGKNLTDKEYTDFALGGLNTLWALAPPRTVGIEFDYRF